MTEIDTSTRTGYHVKDATRTGFTSRDSVKDVWGPRTPFYGEGAWPSRQDENTDEAPEEWIPSACIMCSIGCGVDVGVVGQGKDRRIVGVRGRPNDRVNKGRLGPKGMNCHGNINHHADRLLYPQVRKNGELVRVSWDEAMETIVRATKDTLRTLGNHGLAYYTSGQLFAEEYYTLATMTKAGLGSLHCDGNTRLCTATAAAAMRESFGCDGQPSSYTDIDTTSCIFLVGHNPASTGTVLWTRILDRLAGPRPPKLVVMDSRRSPTAEKATVHLSPKTGTNLAVLNGLIRLLFDNHWVDEQYIERSTIGRAELQRTCAKYTPEYVEEISGIPATQLLEAAKILGKADRLLCTALQGVYQSHQATSSACAINNIALIRGMIGKHGGGVLQMNGQPTAQNNREAGANGEFPGFRNHKNPVHMQDLADHWKVDVKQVPHWNEPTHIMDIMKYIQNRSVNNMWISGTNPAVSIPDSERFRQLVTQREVFLVVQDIFPTETAQLADVVLPAAMWSEKTGIYTNVDRTVHLANKAVDPPGECKSDLDIWVDFATRMDFRDKNGDLLIHWKDPESAFEAWKASTVGRPCDYSGMSYKTLYGHPIQWPCNESAPNGTERLYTEGVFPTDVEHCESWGHDHQTAAPLSKEEYSLLNPNGKAILKTADYVEPLETVNDEFPFRLSTGRSVYHFHTRSKTGRSKRLEEARPEAVVYINAADAEKLEIKTGDMAIVKSRRGEIEVPAEVSEIEQGCVFVPFHFGTFDSKDGRPRAANELTMTKVDPISKQPAFKGGAVSVRRAEGVKLHSRHDHAIQRAKDRSDADRSLQTKRRPPHLADMLALVEVDIQKLGELYDDMKDQHKFDLEMVGGFDSLRLLLNSAYDSLAPFLEKWADGQRDALTAKAQPQVDRVRNSLFARNRPTNMLNDFASLMDLSSCRVLLASVQSLLVMLGPTSLALRDKDGFEEAVAHATKECQRQAAWIEAQLGVRAPQTLIVPSIPSAQEEASDAVP